MKIQTLLAEEENGMLHYGGSRMALLDIEAGFWGLRRQMELLVGRQLTENALQQAGANDGVSFARSFIQGDDQETTAATTTVQALAVFQTCVAAYQVAGFGQFDVEVLQWPLGRIRVRGQISFEAWMMQQHEQLTDHPACAYTSGVFVGFINALTNRRDIVCI